MLLQAIQKLDRETQEFKGGQKEKAVSGPVADTIKSFCRQDAEFAQAVAQCEKTLSDCCAHAVKGSGNAISDIDVYRKAAEFYFPGCQVKMEMNIIVNPAEIESGKENNVINLSLDDLFD